MGAAVLGAALLWQFSSLLVRPTADMAVSSATAPRAAGPGTLPRASADVAALPASAAPLPGAGSPDPSRLAAAPDPGLAAALAVPVPVPMSVPASAGPAEVVQGPGLDARRSLVTRHASASTVRRSAALREPATAREACGNRTFISLAMCLDRQCERPRFRREPSCERMLQAKRRRSGEY